MALTREDARALVRLAEERRRILMVGHVLESHPAVVALGDLVRSGELGKVHYIYSTRLSLGKVRREENILWSFAPHDIAVIQLRNASNLKKITVANSSTVKVEIRAANSAPAPIASANRSIGVFGTATVATFTT